MFLVGLVWTQTQSECAHAAIYSVHSQSKLQALFPDLDEISINW